MKDLLKSWPVLASLAVGVLFIFLGMALLENVGELRDRTEQRVAVVENAQVRFTSLAGREYLVPLQDSCKRAEPPPKRGCIARYVTGDEVLVWYDSSNPTHMWKGSTPGGGTATAFLYAGIILVTFTFVTAYMLLVLPSIKSASARLQEIVNRQSRPRL